MEYRPYKRFNFFYRGTSIASTNSSTHFYMQLKRGRNELNNQLTQCSKTRHDTKITTSYDRFSRGGNLYISLVERNANTDPNTGRPDHTRKTGTAHVENTSHLPSIRQHEIWQCSTPRSESNCSYNSTAYRSKEAFTRVVIPTRPKLHQFFATYATISTPKKNLSSRRRQLPTARRLLFPNPKTPLPYRPLRRQTPGLLTYNVTLHKKIILLCKSYSNSLGRFY